MNSSYGYKHYSKGKLHLRSRYTETHGWMPNLMSRVEHTSRSADTPSTIQDYLIAESMNYGLPIVASRCNHLIPCGYRTLTTLSKKTVHRPLNI